MVAYVDAKYHPIAARLSRSHGDTTSLFKSIECPLKAFIKALAVELDAPPRDNDIRLECGTSPVIVGDKAGSYPFVDTSISSNRHKGRRIAIKDGGNCLRPRRVAEVREGRDNTRTKAARVSLVNEPHPMGVEKLKVKEWSRFSESRIDDSMSQLFSMSTWNTSMILTSRIYNARCGDARWKHKKSNAWALLSLMVWNTCREHAILKARETCVKVLSSVVVPVKDSSSTMRSVISCGIAKVIECMRRTVVDQG